MAADTPPATPTPEGLAAALRLIDRTADRFGASDPAGIDAALLAALIVARTAICCDLAGKEFTAGGYQNGEAVFRARDHHVAAVARLVALATGAKAGEGAGAS